MAEAEKPDIRFEDVALATNVIGEIGEIGLPAYIHRTGIAKWIRIT